MVIFNGFWIGIIKVVLIIFIVWVIGDFVFLFGWCGEGDVFMEKNIVMFKSGVNSLIWVGVWVGIVGLILFEWIIEKVCGMVMDFIDFVFVVVMMGVILYGFVLIFEDVVWVKCENDGFI